MAGQPRLPGHQLRKKALLAWAEESLVDEADELASRMDVSRSWVVRRAVIEYLEHERAQDVVAR